MTIKYSFAEIKVIYIIFSFEGSLIETGYSIWDTPTGPIPIKPPGLELL